MFEAVNAPGFQAGVQSGLQRGTSPVEDKQDFQAAAQAPESHQAASGFPGEPYLDSSKAGKVNEVNGARASERGIGLCPRAKQLDPPWGCNQFKV
jgi:hypothetical protein